MPSYRQICNYVVLPSLEKGPQLTDLFVDDLADFPREYREGHWLSIYQGELKDPRTGEVTDVARFLYRHFINPGLHETRDVRRRGKICNAKGCVNPLHQQLILRLAPNLSPDKRQKAQWAKLNDNDDPDTIWDNLQESSFEGWRLCSSVDALLQFYNKRQGPYGTTCEAMAYAIKLHDPEHYKKIIGK